MANEHVLMWETDPGIPFTVANATGIEKGTALQLTDPMTASAVSAVRNHVAGVAKGEKIASDGRTKLEVFRGGIFKAVASGTITKGDALISDHVGNKLASAAALTLLSGHIIWGVSLETCTDAETFLYELRPQYINAGAAGGIG